MTLTLRFMEIDDIPQVSFIDRLSFDPPWPPNSYVFEINTSTHSYMVVLENAELPPVRSVARWWDRLRGRNSHEDSHAAIVGYGGLWKIAEEAHISTVASHPDHRGHSYGEILLASMIGRSIALGAEYIVLEVRVSNTVAQSLYKKYGFQVVDVKKGYYRSNNEDAYDMRLQLDDDANIQQFRKNYEALQQRIPFVDAFTYKPHPRLG